MAENGLRLRTAVEGTFKDADENNREVLLEFPHERLDSFKTRFAPEAFRDSFAQELPIMCWQHKLDEPIGRAVDAQVTPRVNELRARFDDFDAVPLAHRAFTQISSGTITDFSFGFKDEKFDPRQRGRIVQAYMKEISPVSVGSIPGAKAVGVRADLLEGAMEVQEIEAMSDELIASLASSGVIPQEACRSIMLQRHPELREHIRLQPHEVTADSIRSALEESHPEIALALREQAIILSDGSFDASMLTPTEPEPEPADEGQRSEGGLDEDTTGLIFAIDSALATANTLDPAEAEVLYGAATRASHELLNRLGYRDDSMDDYSLEHSYEGETGHPNRPTSKVCFDGHVVDAKHAVCPAHGSDLSAAMETELAHEHSAEIRIAKKAGPKVSTGSSSPSSAADTQRENEKGRLLAAAEKSGYSTSRADFAAQINTRAELSTEAKNDLPDEAFAYIEPGTTKDGSGKTIPRSKRHFPIHDAPHAKNALARIGAGAEFGEEALPKVKKAAKKFGIDAAESKRAEDALQLRKKQDDDDDDDDDDQYDGNDDDGDDDDDDDEKARAEALSVFEKRGMEVTS